MRILIVSDLHGNYDAVNALREPFDELWVLGDLVNYGPQPREVIAWARVHASQVVRGNHDHAIGFDLDPRCSPRFREMAAETARFTAAVLQPDEKEFLRQLPLHREIRAAGTTFCLLHAIPSEPLFGYCEADSPQWKREVRNAAAEVILVGHTHMPAIRRVGSKLVINPGSLGQPKIGRPEACYAVWEDGQADLKSCPYPYESTIRKVQALPIPRSVRDDLALVLRTGSVSDVQAIERSL
ncbi:MAG TPA: metallophosphoesterase family protein [Terriglobales bacterium]|nr:metallophosphoesterase family protein [Terriglobales bacterium]